MRHATRSALALAVLATALLLLGTGAAWGDDCARLGGTAMDGECWVNSEVSVSGSYFVTGTLRIQSAGRLVVPQTFPPSGPNTLTLSLGGSLIMEVGASVIGDAAFPLGNPGGAGAGITVTAGRDVTLRGSGAAGAHISANGDRSSCAGDGRAGDISVTAIRGDIRVESGAEVVSDSLCPTGAISLASLQGALVVDGLVESASGTPAVRPPTDMKSGPITLAAGRNLTVSGTGRVSSRGLDSADRVHVESGIDTTIRGLVESRSGTVFVANSCTGATRPGKPAQAAACVEIWVGGALTIDNSTRSETAVFAQTGAFGTTSDFLCCGWIDLFANGDISITGTPTLDLRTPFAVNALQFSTNGASFGGTVTVKSVKGKVSARGHAIITDAAAGTGGTITIEAGGPTLYPVGSLHAPDPASNADLYDAYISAAGVTGHGSIFIRSFNGDITGGPASNGATLDASGPGGGVTFEINFCGNASYTGNILPALTTVNPVVCGGNPSPPAFVSIPKPPPIVTVTGGTFVEAPPQAFPAAVTVTGLSGEDLIAGSNASLLTVVYTDASGAPLPGAPSAIGAYSVLASFAGDANYRPASETGTIFIVASDAPQAVINITTANTTLTVDPATGKVVSAATVVTYNGLPRPETGTVTPPDSTTVLGLPVFTYMLDSTTLGGPPTDAGAYTFTAEDPGQQNYRRADPVTGTLSILKVDPTLNLRNFGTFVYDGFAKRVVGEARGIGDQALLPTLTFSYADAGGNPLPSNVFPADAGTYSILASFAGNANYNPASQTVGIVIVPATPTVRVPDVTVPFGVTPAVTAAVIALDGGLLPSSGVTFTFDGSPAAPTEPGTYTITASFPGLAPNYGPATGTGTLTILGNKAATVTVSGGTFVYDGGPHAATGTVTGEGGVVLGTPTLIYNGSPAVPVDAGTYGVLGSFAGDTQYAPATGTALLAILPATPTITLAGTGTFASDGQPHAVTATVTGVSGEVLSPVAVTYNGSPIPPVLPGTYAVLATFEGSRNYTRVSAAGTITLTGPRESCILVDFREITYFRDNTVMTSSDPAIRSRNGLAGGFAPAVWPYSTRGGSHGSLSRGTLFRIYGFKPEMLGQGILDYDDVHTAYPVQADAEIPGVYFIDLGKPARVIVCPSQLEENLLEDRARLEASNFAGTGLLPEAEKNVPGITLNHNAARVKVPQAVKDELRVLGMPLLNANGTEADYGVVEFIGVQQYGHGYSTFREFAEVEVTFLEDPIGTDPVSRRQHFTFGFHTVKRGDLETGVGCSYVDYGPGNDGLRYNDVWAGRYNGHPIWGEACGAKEQRVNQVVREDYDVPLNSVQILSTVNSNDDTVRLLFGEIWPEGQGPIRSQGNNGVGNGLDPQPPGNPPVNDGLGTAPGSPGNQKP